MNKENVTNMNMMTPEKIYRIMQCLPVVVALVFLVINLVKGNLPAIAAIGICLAAFLGLSWISNKKKFDLYKKEYILAIALPTLVFVISLFSGASYSDDFPLFLAVIAMTGMFLEPCFSRMQMVLVDVYLVIMYLVHPEKSGGLSQYILCAACFTLATALIYQVIKRGRAFIEVSEKRAAETEAVLHSIRAMGVELQTDFDASSVKINRSTNGLQMRSAEITDGAGEVSKRCHIVQDKVRETGETVGMLNEGVKQFEEALTENKGNVNAMDEQITSISETISEAGSMFRTMENQMNDIVGIAKQINDISFKLTILSLNASVESAHAGNHGSGFEVIAAEMRELSETSAGFAEQVADVVKELHERVDQTSKQFAGSEQAMLRSKASMDELVGSFERLSEQFDVLYRNIECQNRNVNQIDYIFAELNQKASDMYNSSVTNQQAVSDIAEAMSEFSSNVVEIVKNTQSI